MNHNCLKVKVKGKNVNNYLQWLIKQKININKLKIINHNELELVIESKNYICLSKYSKSYKISIIEKYGNLKIFNNIKKYQYIYISIIISIIILYILSKIIFSVDIVYNDQELVDKLSKELSSYNIKKYKFKKDTKYLNEVKEEILKNNKDTLEWIEIEESGTKYIVKLVERKKENKQNEYTYQSIAVTKDVIITSIKAQSGEKVKTINQYVKKDEIVISGILTKPDGTNIYKKATGQVIGEVWYKVKIDYPLYYQEEEVTGKNKYVLNLYFLNHKIPIFPYSKYKQFKTQNKSIIESNYIPIKLSKEKLYEVKVKEEIYTEETAIEKAIELAKKKLKEKNKEIISINQIEILSKKYENSKIELSLFIAVDENVTKIVEIKASNE